MEFSWVIMWVKAAVDPCVILFFFGDVFHQILEHLKGPETSDPTSVYSGQTGKSISVIRFVLERHTERK